jgi:hypothetical protein
MCEKPPLKQTRLLSHDSEGAADAARESRSRRTLELRSGRDVSARPKSSVGDVSDRPTSSVGGFPGVFILLAKVEGTARLIHGHVEKLNSSKVLIVSVRCRVERRSGPLN